MNKHLYISKVFDSGDVSGKALRAMIKIAGIKQNKIAGELNIAPDYLTKILNDDRDSQEMRLKIKKYLYDVAIVTNNLQTKLAA